MAGSLAALKHLPCPAGNSCTAFQCLFKHDRDDNKAVAAPEQPLIQDQTLALEEQESVRKRRRLDASNKTTDSPPITSQDTREKQGGKVTGKTTQTSSSDQGSSNKRKAPTTPSTVRKSQVTANKESTRKDIPLSISRQPSEILPSSTTAADASKLAVKKTSRGPEALNPRLLKKAPAPHDTRLKLCRLLREEYARLNTGLKKQAKNDDEKALLLSEQELITRTLDDEEELATTKSLVYSQTLKNLIMRYKRMTVAQWREERAKAVKSALPEAKKDLPSPGQPIVTGLTTAQEVDFLHRLVLPLDGLERFGYVGSVPSDVDIEKAREAVEASANTEVCDRCTRRFQVFPGRREEDGALASNGSCTFHPGKIYYTDRDPMSRAAGGGSSGRAQRKFRCCHRSVEGDGEFGGAAGCTTAPTHVFKTNDPKRLAAVLNFAETPDNPDVPPDRAVAFDCEMGYTVYGMELLRITAVSWPAGEELLDVLVQPLGTPMDLNTRYSGVRPEDLLDAERLKPGDDHRPTTTTLSLPSPTNINDATATQQAPQRKLKLAPSPKAARDLFFSLIGPSTPLVGHGLENDLNAVRVVHRVCVDTVLLYPHRRGLPVRNSLKMLVEAFLGRKIQVDKNDDVVPRQQTNGDGGAGGEQEKTRDNNIINNAPEGHDSAEDARAAGELVRLKVRDQWRDMLRNGWSIGEDGMIAAPR